MPIAWPAVNVDVLRNSYKEQPEDNVDSFKPDVGPSIDISRTIMSCRSMSFQQWFTTAEYTTIEAWRRVTLKNGVLSFNRIDPMLGDVGEFKFLKDGFKLEQLLPMFRLVSFNIYRLS